MGNLISGLEFLNAPTIICLVVVGLFIVLQVIGEIVEFAGKTVPEILKVRKIFKRKKEEKAEEQQTLKDVQQLLKDVNEHYSTDNISKRNNWMQHINDKELEYDASVKELKALKEKLEINNELTLNLYIESHRNRILDFASKVANEQFIVSQEEFHQIFHIYDEYEKTLKQNNLKNGAIDTAYHIIQEAYQDRLKHQSFLENIRGLPLK